MNAATWFSAQSFAGGRAPIVEPRRPREPEDGDRMTVDRWDPVARCWRRVLCERHDGVWIAVAAVDGLGNRIAEVPR